MIYIYRQKASNGARELSEAITVNSRRINDLQKAHFGQGVRSGDKVVCWGEHLPDIEGVSILNGKPISNKFEDAITLKENGVVTVEVNNVRPPVAEPFDCLAEVHRIASMMGTSNLETVRTQVATIQEYLNRPPAPVVEWLPRKFHHVGGNDLLHPPAQPDYFARKENLVKEYRIHWFNGRSIRAGVKQPIGTEYHPWIRSFDGEWSTQYDGFGSTAAMRRLASKAVKALQLDFAAVDLGEKDDGSLIVLEVNRAPGIEGGTVTAYANAIKDWANDLG